MRRGDEQIRLATVKARRSATQTRTRSTTRTPACAVTRSGHRVRPSAHTRDETGNDVHHGDLGPEEERQERGDAASAIASMFVLWLLPRSRAPQRSPTAVRRMEISD